MVHSVQSTVLTNDKTFRAKATNVLCGCVWDQARHTPVRAANAAPALSVSIDTVTILSDPSWILRLSLCMRSDTSDISVLALSDVTKTFETKKNTSCPAESDVKVVEQPLICQG
eukprot:3936060-Rhodomonas_salina.1